MQDEIFQEPGARPRDAAETRLCEGRLHLAISVFDRLDGVLVVTGRLPRSARLGWRGGSVAATELLELGELLQVVNVDLIGVPYQECAASIVDAIDAPARSFDG